jgi:predicted molibdopterin-dependent oxidoreductase YjgC
MSQVRENRHGAGRIERHPLLGLVPGGQRVTITFDGSAVPAIAGESLLAALLAIGIRAVRTMPRTGEPRGGYCLVGRCADCLVIVNGMPNVYACQTTVSDGMVVETQHELGRWPEACS